MLGEHISTTELSKFEQLWEAVDCRVKLPDDDSAFFECHGPLQGKYSDRRRYQRYHLRSRAILKAEGQLYGVYTKDVSRCGLVVLFCRQLFPRNRVELIMPDGRKMTLVVRRCRRLAELCYECGCDIHM